MNFRIENKTDNNILQLDSAKNCEDVKRKFYDLSKIAQQGRNKQEESLGSKGLLEEVVTWAITATV